MELALDHVIVAVPDLAAAAEALETRGLRAVPGGRHLTLGTENGDPSWMLDTWLPGIDHVVVGASGQPGVQGVVLPVDDRELRLEADAFTLP